MPMNAERKYRQIYFRTTRDGEVWMSLMFQHSLLVDRGLALSFMSADLEQVCSFLKFA